MSSKSAFVASVGLSMVALTSAADVSIDSTAQKDAITLDLPAVGSNSGSSKKGTPAAGVITLVEEGMYGWSAWPQSQFGSFPLEYYAGFTAFVPHDLLVPAGSSVKFRCPRSQDFCDAVVFLYQCYPCETKQGELARYLVDSGFTRTRCGPSFSTGSGSGWTHKMSAFVRPVKGGTEETFYIEADTTYVFFAMNLQGSIPCQALSADPDVCMDPSNEFVCSVATGKCDYNRCHNLLPVPYSGCPADKCVAKDFPY